MRIVKNTEVRKNEILDAAGILFAEKGFDDTSVTDIMNAVCIAKGTLYHHFKSKEDIMDALIDRQTAALLSAAGNVAEDKSIPVMERMLRTILALHVDPRQTEGKEMIQHLHKPQNALMHQKTKQIILKQVPLMLSDIVRDGIAQGLFDTPFPLECMEMALCYLDTMLDDDVFELTEEQKRCKVRAFIFHMEKLLGAKTGTLSFFEETLIKERGEE